MSISTLFKLYNIAQDINFFFNSNIPCCIYYSFLAVYKLSEKKKVEVLFITEKDDYIFIEN
jgi:hypothetical protein